MSRGLTKREKKIVAAFAEVLLPLDMRNPLMPVLVDKVEDQLKLFTLDMQIAWRASLWVFELLAFFYYGKRRLMSSMDVALRARYVGAWHHTWWSVKRTLKRFLEAIVFLNYYSLSEVEEKIGYKPKFRSSKKSDSWKDTPVGLVKEFPVNDEVIETDVCVIGSGAGGAMAACSLAESGRSVVVLEEGAYFDEKDFGEDAMTMTKRLYRSGGLFNTFGYPSILVPLGRCLGGTTVINSGTCFRAPQKVFRWWVERFGLANWSYERLDIYYDKVEKILGVETAEDEFQSNAGRVFARGAKECGMEVRPLERNAPNCTGSGFCCWGCPSGGKKSVQLNAIPLSLKAGAKIYTRCRAERIIFERKHATEVLGQFIDPVMRIRGPKIRIKAKSVIVSCGTIHTPIILARSGIPNPSGQRGHNLTLHPACKVMALFDEEISGWRGIPQGFYSDALAEDGIKLEGIFLPPASTAATILLTGKEHEDVMGRYNNLGVFGMMVSDTTRGRVIRGIGGHAITVYNINKTDLPKYQEGITHLAKAFFAAGATKVLCPIHTLPMVTREEGAARIARLKLRNKDLDLQAFHPLGTCRMGADPRESVLDPSARVYGLDNVFVADGSIFPTALGVNPQMTIMAAALKTANFVDREYL